MRYRLRWPAFPSYRHLRSTVFEPCVLWPMHPEGSPSSRFRSSSPALPTIPGLEHRSAVPACVYARSASLPRRSGIPACCSLPSLPASTEHASADSPSDGALQPTHAAARVAVRWLRKSAPLAVDNETDRKSTRLNSSHLGI